MNSAAERWLRIPVERAIRTAFHFLSTRYDDPQYVDDFPSLAEAFRVVEPHLDENELTLLNSTFTAHERGRVPPDCAASLRALNTTHELRLLTNIWATKESWLEELSRAGVLECFRRTVFSSDTRSVKPSKLLLERVLEGLTCERQEVLMIGDSIARDMLPARRAGLATLWISAQRALPADVASLVDYVTSSIPALTVTATRAG